jgi:hypothetical protein
VSSKRRYILCGGGTETVTGFEGSQVVPALLLVKVGWRERGVMGSKLILIIFKNSVPTSTEACSIFVHKDHWFKLFRKTATFY